MNNIEICAFTEEYMDDLMRINSLSFHTPWTRESMENELTNKFARYIVAKLDDIAIGYGGLWLIIDEGHITNIAVHPEYRGVGAGDAIVEALTEICKLESVHSITLEVRKSNIVAQNLYTKHGFAEEGIRKGYYADPKEDGVIMWKRISGKEN